MIPGQPLPAGVQLGDLKGAWAVTLKALLKGNPDMSAREVEDRRIAFYMGACAYQAILNNAAKLPDPYPVQVINSLDAECDAFKAKMHAVAQREVDAARARERGEIQTDPGGLPGESEKPS